MVKQPCRKFHPTKPVQQSQKCNFCQAPRGIRNNEELVSKTYAIYHRRFTTVTIDQSQTNPFKADVLVTGARPASLTTTANERADSTSKHQSLTNVVAQRYSPHTIIATSLRELMCRGPIAPNTEHDSSRDVFSARYFSHGTAAMYSIASYSHINYHDQNQLP